MDYHTVIYKSVDLDQTSNFLQAMKVHFLRQLSSVVPSEHCTLHMTSLSKKCLRGVDPHCVLDPGPTDGAALVGSSTDGAAHQVATGEEGHGGLLLHADLAQLVLAEGEVVVSSRRLAGTC